VYKKNKKFKHAQGILDQRFKICLYATTPYAVPTLRELVVENVGKNIQHWVSLLHEDNYSNKNNTSPLQCLSTEDTLDILKRTIGHNYDEQPLKLFLHNRLTKFDLSLIKPTSQLAAIKILLERCDKIKELAITDVNNVAFQDCQLALLSINFIKELSFNDKSFSSLVIPCCCITKNSFELLVNFKSLKKLSLVLPVNLDLDTLTILISSLTMLQELSLIPSTIDFENFTGDVKFNNILNLNIS